MFEKTREVVRKDRFGFPEEPFLHRAIIMGSPHAGLSRKELTLMTGCDPILAGDIQDNPSFNPRLPPSQDNFLCTVTVTVDLLGGTRNLLYDGGSLYLVHGERKFRLNDESLLRKRASHLGVKIRELANAFEDLEEHILQTLTAKRLQHTAHLSLASNRE